MWRKRQCKRKRPRRRVLESSDSELSDGPVDSQASEASDGDESDGDESDGDESDGDESDCDESDACVLPLSLRVAMVRVLETRMYAWQKALGPAGGASAPERGTGQRRSRRDRFAERDLDAETSALRAELQLQGCDALVTWQHYWAGQLNTFYRKLESGWGARALAGSCAVAREGVFVEPTEQCCCCGRKLYGGGGVLVVSHAVAVAVHEECAYKLHLYGRVWSALAAHGGAQAFDTVAVADVGGVLVASLKTNSGLR